MNKSEHFFVAVLSQANEKYTGNVQMLDGGTNNAHYLAKNNNVATMSNYW